MNVRLTPINIGLACILAWYITEYNAENPVPIAWGWLIVFVIFLSVVDIWFRMRYSNTGRLWMMQIGFILVVSIILIIIKIQF
ncbi:MAG TPA: hypothetical protein VK102_07705 [Sphingobacterium sp.]|nr:hypothetical protein [Sphingobacterium sp.]